MEGDVVVGLSKNEESIVGRTYPPSYPQWKTVLYHFHYEHLNEVIRNRLNCECLANATSFYQLFSNEQPLIVINSIAFFQD